MHLGYWSLPKKERKLIFLKFLNFDGLFRLNGKSPK